MVSREDGFSLAELLVALAFLGLVLAGIVTIFQRSQETYTRASSQEEAQQGARDGIDRLASELRFLGAFSTGVPGAGAAIVAAGPTSLTFVGDLDGDTVVAEDETTTTARADTGATSIAVSGAASQVAGSFNVYPDATRNDWVYIGAGARPREVRQLAGVLGTSLTLATPLDSAASGYPEYPAGSLVRSIETVTYAFDPGTGQLTRRLGGAAPEVLVDNVTDFTLTYFDAAGTPTTVTEEIREIQVSLTTRGTDGSPHTMMTRVKPWSLG